MAVVAIHQPEYFPWLGLLDKARRADVFVFLDNVQFDRSSLQHRAKVVGANGVTWLTIPFVHKFPQAIDEVRAVDGRWATKHEKTLQACYGRAPGFAAASAKLAPFFASPSASLCDVAIGSTRLLLDAFGVTTRCVRASELAARGEKGELVLAICKELGATRYLSGRSGATYLDGARFEAEGVHVEVQAYTPPRYPRLREVAAEDDLGISALDAWLNLGAGAPELLRGGST
ncbi:MAG TPA: WbqC family protein [Byssovorax sp.]